MKSKLLRFKGVKLKQLPGSCGIELDQDFPGVEVGKPILLPPNGRFMIGGKQISDDGHVHLTLVRDQSTRKQRRRA